LSQNVLLRLIFGGSKMASHDKALPGDAAF
jgi:hypothetical protein